MRPHTIRLVIAAAVLTAAALTFGEPDDQALPLPILTKLAAAPRPFDSPDLADAFYRMKRSGSMDPRGAYDEARLRMREMPRYSTRDGAFLDRQGHSNSRRVAGTLDSWEELGPGNIGGRTRALVIHPKTTRIMYAGGVSGGVWKTTNSGRRWRPVGDELANLAVNTLAMDPDSPKILYAGTGEGYFREKVRGTGLPLRGGGIFKSEDGGASWAQLAKARKKAFLWVNDIVISVQDSARVYAATRKGVFRSTDGGASWRRVLRSRENGGCLQLVLREDRCQGARVGRFPTGLFRFRPEGQHRRELVG